MSPSKKRHPHQVPDGSESSGQRITRIPVSRRNRLGKFKAVYQVCVVLIANLLPAATPLFCTSSFGLQLATLEELRVSIDQCSVPRPVVNEDFFTAEYQELYDSNSLLVSGLLYEYEGKRHGAFQCYRRRVYAYNNEVSKKESLRVDETVIANPRYYGHLVQSGGQYLIVRVFEVPEGRDFAGTARVFPDCFEIPVVELMNSASPANVVGGAAGQVVVAVTGLHGIVWRGFPVSEAKLHFAPGVDCWLLSSIDLQFREFSDEEGSPRTVKSSYVWRSKGDAQELSEQVVERYLSKPSGGVHKVVEWMASRSEASAEPLSHSNCFLSHYGLPEPKSSGRRMPGFRTVLFWGIPVLAVAILAARGALRRTAGAR